MKLSGHTIVLLLLAVVGCSHSRDASAVVDDLTLKLLNALNITDDKELVPVPPVVFDNEIGTPKHQSRANECNLNIKTDLISPQPVFVTTNKAEFYPYSDTGDMVINAGGSLQMWCSDQFKSFSQKLLTATCIGGKTFRVNGINYDLDNFVCKTWPTFVAQRTGRSCNGGEVMRVGFQIDDDRFIEQMQVCFNEEEEVTRYVRHTLNAASKFYQSGVERLTFQTAGFFGGKNVDKLYTQVSQLATIDAALGGNAAQFFDTSRNIFLARGHMGAKADFVYATQQRATFLFINVAPQWQVFNAGNWARVEDGVRSWVSKNQMKVNCYTGVWGVTTLPNKWGEETPLYLDYDENNNGLIPVPKLYFRVIIEPATKRGIVFVGVNNPHLTMQQIEADYILCNDVSDQVTYINWKKNDITAGYSYACEVEEFLSVVPHLPALTATGGLLV